VPMTTGPPWMPTPMSILASPRSAR